VEKEKYDVWAVVKNDGGTNAVLPIIDQLRAAGLKVLLLAAGRGVTLIQKQNREFTPVLSAEAFLAEQQSTPKMLLTSMCDDGGVGRDLALLLRGNVKIVAVQDFWGAQMRSSWSDPACRPDYLLVNDVAGKCLTKELWPEFNQDRVLITGYASLDKYALVDVNAENKKVRSKLGLTDLPIVLFAGQLEDTGATLSAVVDVLNELAVDCYLLPRLHPGLRAVKKEQSLWQQALASYKGRTIVDWFMQCETHELITVCAGRRGVVVSMYSTMLLEAAALRAPALSVLYPDIGGRNLAQHFASEFPLTKLGCAAKAVNRQQLRTQLSLALDKKLGQEEAQEKHFKVEGNNGRRAADYLRSII
jgi:hypothetical protein